MQPESPEKKPIANKRGIARLLAVQALYQMEITAIPLADVIKEYETYRFDQEIDGVVYLKSDPQWFRAILAGVVDQQSYFDPLIRQNLIREWSLSRLDAILRAILRAACFELKNKLEVPTAVIISEYVDIAKAFFSNEEPKMVNAVLDKIAKIVRP